MKGIRCTPLVLLLTGCLASLPPDPAVRTAPRFDPIAFFEGRTHGAGRLERRFGKDRALTVEGTGVVGTDGALTLEQIITYADGVTDKRRWVVRRVDSTHFAATLSDAAGDVSAVENGNMFHLNYRIQSPRVVMDQKLYLSPDGRSADNRAEVKVLGIPWIHLSETITKVP